MYSILFAALLAGAPPTPPSKFAPVLHIRVVAPDGVRVTARPGSPESQTYPAPAQFGFRPGYIYRLRLDNIPDEPSTYLEPSIEVRGTLFMPVTLKPEDFPATLTVTRDDVQRVLIGAVVTKVIYLEDPDDPLPEESTPNCPIEITVLRGDDPLEMARRRGRVMAIVRIGGRNLTQEELIKHEVPGTVQCPGEPLLPPMCPPTLPSPGFQVFDPRLGPKIPHEELLNDGGDVGPRIGIGPNGHLGNVDPTDTAIEYRSGTTKRSAVSNRICLFAPRFPILRQELAPAGYDLVTPPIPVESISGPNIARVNRPTEFVDNKVTPAAMIQRLMVKGIHVRQGTHEVDVLRGTFIAAQVEGVIQIGGVVEPLEFTQYRDQCKPNDPLVLIKTASPREAQPGDIVTFTIKFVNYGNRPAKDAIVADSLSPRLEYVPGSSRGDRPTVFTQQSNAVGSVILRWELSGEIPQGQSGIVQFQAKVR